MPYNEETQNIHIYGDSKVTDELLEEFNNADAKRAEYKKKGENANDHSSRFEQYLRSLGIDPNFIYGQVNTAIICLKLGRSDLLLWKYQFLYDH